jgi:hypothetical protein
VAVNHAAVHQLEVFCTLPADGLILVGAFEAADAIAQASNRQGCAGR